jgi:polysaccharide chain length determinant protein (PEP-CTERM system associated)
VFLRRLPYFLVVAALISAVGVTLAAILPPTYRSEASILVEPQQISGELVQATVEVNPYEQAQIIARRIMTQPNLTALAERVGLYAGEPEMTPSAMAADIAERIEFIGFTPAGTQINRVPGATVIGVAFEAEDPQFAVRGANELVNLVLAENVRLRTDRAGGTAAFFQAEADRLRAAVEAQSARIAEMKTANVDALPDSLAARRAQQEREQERLLALEREEAALRNQRATVVWVFERTGRTTAQADLSPEEEELAALKSELLQQRSIYAAGSPRIRVLESRIGALESLVEEQRAARVVPDADGNAAPPPSELEVELAPIDDRLEFIAAEKAGIQATLAALDASIQATPANEMTLAGLERELANLSDQYETARTRLNEAMVGERMEVMSKGERFTLVQPPTEPTSPDRPNRVLIAGAGVVGGLGLGLSLVLLLEMLNRSIRRPVEIFDRLGVQPFAAIPYIRTRRERTLRRRAIAAALFLALVAVPLGLWAVHSFVAPLDLMLMNLGEGAGAAPADATE